MRSIKQLSDLTGRVALVTGGAGHIGSAVCAALAECGAEIVVVDLETERVEAEAKRLAKAHSVDAMGLAVDLEHEEAVRDIPHRVGDKFGRLDIIVNCAAMVGTSAIKGWSVPFAEQSMASWRRALEINLTAPVVLVQAAADLLGASGHGSVINLSSIYGLVGPDWRLYEGTELGNPAAYAASKGGLVQMTRWLATTLAPEIRVNAVAPGGIFRDTPDAFHKRYVERTPMRRMGTEEDIKGAVLFLASDLSAYVTGQCLAVDGGWTAW